MVKKGMITCHSTCLTSSFKMFVLITGLSALALGGALASQFIGGLEPCILCLYQRIPFIVTIALGLIGLVLHKDERIARALIGLCALAFLVNAAIAFYHTGVELKWWESGVEGCKVALAGEDESTANWIDRITAAPAVPCTDIQWKDPVLGLTMANYNFILNSGLFFVCVMSVALKRRQSRTENQTPA